MRRVVCGTVATVAAIPSMAGSAGAAPRPSPPVIHPHPFAAAATGQSLPDDVTTLGKDVFVTYQNGVGPDGAPSMTGVKKSSVVEYGAGGKTVRTWQITGRVDGLTADPAHGRIFATSNEDLNSSLYVIDPTKVRPMHYTYSPSPTQQAAGETSANGGTDSVSIGTYGTVYVAHSNPDPGFPHTAATYEMTLDGTTAHLRPTFPVDGKATDVVTHEQVTLALTDPDSNRFVSADAPVLPQTLLQVAQGDGQIVIVHHPDTPRQHLSRLLLHNAENITHPTIDDVVEVTGPGTLYTVDQKAGTVQTVNTGELPRGSLVVAQPADSGNVGQLGTVNPETGVITHFANTFSSPKGLAFVPRTP